MARARVNISRRGITEALSSPGVERELQRLADGVADAARSSAPADSGAYRESIRTELDRGWVRPRARIIADIAYGMAVEARTGNLRRALGRGQT